MKHMGTGLLMVLFALTAFVGCSSHDVQVEADETERFNEGPQSNEDSAFNELLARVREIRDPNYAGMEAAKYFEGHDDWGPELVRLLDCVLMERGDVRTEGFANSLILSLRQSDPAKLHSAYAHLYNALLDAPSESTTGLGYLLALRNLQIAAELPLHGPRKALLQASPDKERERLKRVYTKFRGMKFKWARASLACVVAESGLPLAEKCQLVTKLLNEDQVKAGPIYRIVCAAIEATSTESERAAQSTSLAELAVALMGDEFAGGLPPKSERISGIHIQSTIGPLGMALRAGCEASDFGLRPVEVAYCQALANHPSAALIVRKEYFDSFAECFNKGG